MSQDSCTLNPWFVTGFTDAEACFRISIIKNKNYKPGLSKDTGGARLTTLPLSVRLYFQIGLHLPLSSFGPTLVKPGRYLLCYVIKNSKRNVLDLRCA